jgi:hypothetical protein
VSEHDLDPPWTRAGGYAQADWVKCLRLATKRRVEASHALEAHVQNTSAISRESIRELDRLKEAERDAIRIRDGVLFGDPKIVSDLFGEVLEAEQPKE